MFICLCMNLERMLEYHHQISKSLEETLSDPRQRNWNDIFAFEVSRSSLSLGLSGLTGLWKVPLMHPTAIAAYKSYCADYLGLVNFLVVEVIEYHVRCDLFARPI